MKTQNITALLFSFLFSFTPWVSGSEAKETLEVSLNKILVTIKDEGLSEDQRKTSVNDKVNTIFSFYHTARFSVGRDWKRFSDEEEEAFIEAFSMLIFNTYYKRIMQSEGTKETFIAFLKERALGKGRVEVLTSVNSKNSEIPIAYRMVTTDQGWRVYDVIVEGVSLISNYRSQFSETLRRGSPSELITTIKEKNESTKDNE